MGKQRRTRHSHRHRAAPEPGPPSGRRMPHRPRARGVELVTALDRALRTADEAKPPTPSAHPEHPADATPAGGRALAVAVVLTAALLLGGCGTRGTADQHVAPASPEASEFAGGPVAVHFALRFTQDGQSFKETFDVIAAGPREGAREGRGSRHRSHRRGMGRKPPPGTRPGQRVPLHRLRSPVRAPRRARSDPGVHDRGPDHQPQPTVQARRAPDRSATGPGPDRDPLPVPTQQRQPRSAPRSWSTSPPACCCAADPFTAGWTPPPPSPRTPSPPRHRPAPRSTSSPPNTPPQPSRPTRRHRRSDCSSSTVAPCPLPSSTASPTSWRSSAPTCTSTMGSSARAASPHCSWHSSSAITGPTRRYWPCRTASAANPGSPWYLRVYTADRERPRHRPPTRLRTHPRGRVRVRRLRRNHPGRHRPPGHEHGDLRCAVQTRLSRRPAPPRPGAT